MSAYMLTKLCKESQNFIASVASSGSSRSLAMTIAAARAVSNALPIPSSPVEDFSNYFSMTHQLSVLDAVNRLNEIFVLDVEKITQLAKDFYAIRYENVYPSKTFFYTRDNPIAGFFSMQKYVNNDVITCICEQGNLVSVYLNALVTLLQEIGQDKAAVVSSLTQA